MDRLVFRTSVCDVLGIEYPICLAGMAKVGPSPNPPVAGPRLVAAVSNAGGLGVLGATVLTPDEIHESVQQIKKMTDKPFGIDLIYPDWNEERYGPVEKAVESVRKDYPDVYELVQKIARDFDLPDVGETDLTKLRFWKPDFIAEQTEAIFSESKNVAVTALGVVQDISPIEEARRRGMKSIALVGSAEHAKRFLHNLPDIIVAQGTDSGGHTGNVGTMSLVPEVIDTVDNKVPVLAAGGIVDGKGMSAALALGASGVWVGTRFEATVEADLFDEEKRRIIDAKQSSTILHTMYTGKTLRHEKTGITKAWGKMRTLPMPLQTYIMWDLYRAIEEANRWDLCLVSFGQAAGQVKRIQTAREVVEGMIAETSDILQNQLRRRIVMSL